MSMWRAYAKINLCLEALGRRRDGYHDLVTILQTIDLYDALTFQTAEEITLTCSDPRLEREDNLVWRAAHLLQRATGVTAGAAIHLEKGIPTTAGLGGGSSDAATTLVALSELWGLRTTDSNLQNLAAALGSDVPFFLVGGTVLARGRGEDLTPLPALPEHWIVLTRPPIEIADKTALMYACLTPREYTTGMVTQHMARAIRAGQALEPGLIFNVFEWVAFRQFDLVDLTRQQVVDAGADHVRLCGAGPSLYAIYNSEVAARSLHERLLEEGLEVYLTRTIEAHPQPIEADVEGDPSASAAVGAVEDVPADAAAPDGTVAPAAVGGPGETTGDQEQVESHT